MYLARLGQDMISVYEAPSMSLLENRSIKIPGICSLPSHPSV